MEGREEGAATERERPKRRHFIKGKYFLIYIYIGCARQMGKPWVGLPGPWAWLPAVCGHLPLIYGLEPPPGLTLADTTQGGVG